MLSVGTGAVLNSLSLHRSVSERVGHWAVLLGHGTGLWAVWQQGRWKRGVCKSCLKFRVAVLALLRANTGPGWSQETITRVCPMHRLSAALHPRWPGCRRRDEDTKAASARFPPLQGYSQHGSAGSGSHPTPGGSCAALGPWIKHRIHRCAVVTRQACSAALNPL